MGLLTHGNSLPWDIIKLHAETLRSRATSQLIKIYNVNKDRSGDTHLFGDEIEYSIIRFDHGKREAKAALLSHEALDLLNGKFKSEEADWQTEVGRFMVEGIPGTPYGASTDDLLDVEKNMKARRKQANTVVAAINTAGGDGDASSLSSTKVVSITTYPRLGCGSDTLYPAGLVVNGPILHSPTLPDKVVTGHERYRHAGYNFAARRNGPLRAFMPVFKDKSTPSPFVYNHPDCAGIEIPDDHIYLDNAVYGPTCSCLQVTMQANNLNQARRLYDQLTVLAPLLMAVSAAAPIFHGHLLDSDCRWGVLEACLDDRSQYECGLLKENPGPDADGCSAGSEYVQPKPRYSAISMFLDAAGERYNDVRLNQDAGTKHELVAAGMDEQLAAHFAFLFTRDPIMVYDYQVFPRHDSLEPLGPLAKPDDGSSGGGSGSGGSEPRLESDLFECLQSTNWNSMRFKPPPPNNRAIGWRVEFRTLEAQFTDFENAAFAVFVVLLGRAVMADPAISFYIPISKSDENMERAQRRGAVAGERFWFRKNVRGSGGGGGGGGGVVAGVADDTAGVAASTAASTTATITPSSATPDSANSADEFGEMSLAQIVDVLANVVDEYLDAVSPSAETRRALDKYIQLIKRRADGTLLTNAAWIRRFVDQHPAYKHDSVVAAETSYDLLAAVADIASGKRAEPLLHGDLLH